jgi:hypothetical protein
VIPEQTATTNLEQLVETTLRKAFGQRRTLLRPDLAGVDSARSIR